LVIHLAVAVNVFRKLHGMFATIVGIFHIHNPKSHNFLSENSFHSSSVNVGIFIANSSIFVATSHIGFSHSQFHISNHILLNHAFNQAVGILATHDTHVVHSSIVCSGLNFIDKFVMSVLLLRKST